MHGNDSGWCHRATRAGLAAQRLWRRRLSHHPDTGRRVLYLAIVVLATIMLYYELYIPGAVSPSIIASFHMTFSCYVYIVVIGNAVGAFGSLAAGLADRWGRANLVAYGLVITALLALFGVPNATNKLTFGVIYAAIAVVEGIILVATPALVRDFSPQLGRASAMGFWTLGPVVGSLVVAIVSSSTQVQNASKAAAGQWRNWWWVAVGGEVVFIPLIFLMTGRWDPRRARRDAAEHEQRVQEELASLRS